MISKPTIFLLALVALLSFTNAFPISQRAVDLSCMFEACDPPKPVATTTPSPPRNTFSWPVVSISPLPSQKPWPVSFPFPVPILSSTSSQPPAITASAPIPSVVVPKPSAPSSEAPPVHSSAVPPHISSQSHVETHSSSHLTTQTSSSVVHPTSSHVTVQESNSPSQGRPLPSTRSSEHASTHIVPVPSTHSTSSSTRGAVIPTHISSSPSTRGATTHANPSSTRKTASPTHISSSTRGVIVPTQGEPTSPHGSPHGSPTHSPNPGSTQGGLPLPLPPIPPLPPILPPLPPHGPPRGSPHGAPTKSPGSSPTPGGSSPPPPLPPPPPPNGSPSHPSGTIAQSHGTASPTTHHSATGTQSHAQVTTSGVSPSHSSAKPSSSPSGSTASPHATSPCAVGKNGKRAPPACTPPAPVPTKLTFSPDITQKADQELARIKPHIFTGEKDPFAGRHTVSIVHAAFPGLQGNCDSATRLCTFDYSNAPGVSNKNKKIKTAWDDGTTHPNPWTQNDIEDVCRQAIGKVFQLNGGTLGVKASSASFSIATKFGNNICVKVNVIPLNKKKNRPNPQVSSCFPVGINPIQETPGDPCSAPQTTTSDYTV
ncbi:unnamed protein product [Somion occarium]|uniref:Uncharacterized protein n=1 Tax=Somion occarium TaxID=3059160 RepID=A0ABP1DMG2_9APHY